MKLSLFIARRYLFARKKRNVINIINWVTLVGIAIGSAAIILVLSTFNGLSNFISDMYSAMDPDIKIVSIKGQLIEEDTAVTQQLLSLNEVKAITRTVEGKILMKYRDRQAFGIIKGVEKNFTDINPLDEYIVAGSNPLDSNSNTPEAILGYFLYAELNADIHDMTTPIKLIYLPNKKNGLLGTSITALKQTDIYPVGLFDAQKEYSDQYLITNFEFAQRFLGFDDNITAYEVLLTPGTDPQKAKKRLEERLSENLSVLTLRDQHESLYRIMRSEKFISYLILTLMLAIAAINIVGSLSMIVLEKTRDIAVLKSMGATPQLIRTIFLLEGFLVGGIGVGLGIFFAWALAYIQQTTGAVKLEGSTLAFPISMQPGDFLLVLITVIFLSILAAVYPSIRAGKLTIISGLRQ